MLSFLNEIMLELRWADLFAFVLGALSVIAWKNVRTVVWNRAHPLLKNISLPKLNARWLTYGFIIVVIALSTFSSYQISSEQRALQHSVESCQREFTTALSARATLNTKLNTLIVADKNATNQFIVTVFTPPPEIAILPNGDPTKNDWFMNEFLNYRQQSSDIQKQRDDIANDLAAHPLPEPSCGR